MVTTSAAPPYATAQRTGSRSHQCDATVVASFKGAAAHVLLDGMGSSDEIARATPATASAPVAVVAVRGTSAKSVLEVLLCLL